MLKPIIVVSIEQQRLQLREADTIVLDTAIATASNGPGHLVRVP